MVDIDCLLILASLLQPSENGQPQRTDHRFLPYEAVSVVQHHLQTGSKLRGQRLSSSSTEESVYKFQWMKIKSVNSLWGFLLDSRIRSSRTFNFWQYKSKLGPEPPALLFYCSVSFYSFTQDWLLSRLLTGDLDAESVSPVIAYIREFLSNKNIFWRESFIWSVLCGHQVHFAGLNLSTPMKKICFVDALFQLKHAWGQNRSAVNHCSYVSRDSELGS